MRSRWLPWLVAMPSVALGLLAGHFVGSHVVVERVGELAEGASEHVVHGSTSAVSLGFLGVMLIVASAVLAGCLRNRNRVGAPPSILFFVLPVVAWPLQEIFERVVHPASSLGWHTLADPSLLIGVLAQIPFAIAAYALARLLFKIIIRIASSLRRAYDRRRSTAMRARSRSITHARST
ncbi:MAG: hypothetical protein ACYDCC_02770 [Actinomycetota bacterium]